MSSPEDRIIDLIEDPYRFFSLQMDAIKAVVAQAYEAGFRYGFDVGRVEEEGAPTFEEWWSGEEFSE